MFNNEVTYDKKWDTPENRAALEKIRKKFFHKSYCWPDCPVGWAPEVLELLETLEKEFGFEYNTGTMQGFYISPNLFKYLLTSPFKELYKGVLNNFIKTPKESYEFRNRKRPVLTRLKVIFESTVHPFFYVARALRIRYVNPILNKIYKPKLRLDQLKEKYGTLRLYFSSPDYLNDYVEKLIARCEVKLAMKGCYFPLESLWGWSRSFSHNSESNPEVYTTESETYDSGETYNNVSVTTHRQAMKDLGIDIKNMDAKHKSYMEEKKNEVSS